MLAKYTDNGTTATFNWSEVGGGSGPDQGNGVAVNGSSIYLTGTIQNNLANATGVVLGGSGLNAGTTVQAGTVTSRPSNNLLVAKYTDNGSSATVNWTQVAGTDFGAQGRGIAVSGTGVYVTGTWPNNLANDLHGLFGGSGLVPGTVVQLGASTSGGYNDIVVAKYTDNGPTATVNWTQVGGGLYNDEGNGIAVSGNRVFVTGLITNNTSNNRAVVFGGAGTTPGTVAQAGATSTVSQDLVVAKYTDNGSTATLDWTQVAGSTYDDAGSSIAASGNSAVVTGPLITGAVFGGSGTTPGTTTITGPGGNELVVAKYTDNGASGTLRWVQTAGGSLLDNGYGVAVSGPNIFVVGEISGIAAFGNITLRLPVGTTGHALGQLTDPMLLAAKPLVVAATGELSLFPNPAHHAAQVLLLGPPTQAPLQVFDAIGRLRLTRPAPVIGRVTELPLANLSAGVYLVRCGTLCQRLVVE